jgi:aryl-alcohol dehydrogenase-like predicted oxidoreductase
MDMRTFGRSGLQLSVLGFGCGAVGGLMVRGDPADQERAVARALEAGVNYFDTAALYGNGESERNLGRLLKKLRPANAIIGTKVRLTTSDLGQIRAEVSSSLEASLQRLGLDRVDIFYLHNPITVTETAESLNSRQVLEGLSPPWKNSGGRARSGFLALQRLGTPKLFKESPTRASLTGRRSPTTC